MSIYTAVSHTLQRELFLSKSNNPDREIGVNDSCALEAGISI